MVSLDVTRKIAMELIESRSWMRSSLPLKSSNVILVKLINKIVRVALGLASREQPPTVKIVSIRNEVESFEWNKLDYL